MERAQGSNFLHWCQKFFFFCWMLLGISKQKHVAFGFNFEKGTNKNEGFGERDNLKSRHVSKKVSLWLVGQNHWMTTLAPHLLQCGTDNWRWCFGLGALATRFIRHMQEKRLGMATPESNIML